MGTQKNRLNETVLLSTQNTFLNYYNFTLIKFPYLDLCLMLYCVKVLNIKTIKLTLWIRETPKRVLLQAVKSRMKCSVSSVSTLKKAGPLAQLVTCLATDACLTADSEVGSLIPVRSHTFVEIDHEMISSVILLPSADLFKKGCCQLQAKVCARITGYPLVQACPGKVWIGELTVPQWP